MHALAKSSVRARLPLRYISRSCNCKASICSILSKGSALNNTRQSSAKDIILEDFGLVQQKMARSVWCAVELYAIVCCLAAQYFYTFMTLFNVLLMYLARLLCYSKVVRPHSGLAPALEAC